MTTLVRRLGLWSSIGLVIGITIGGGIFRTPAGIATRVPDPVFMLGVWVLGGLIVLCGAHHRALHHGQLLVEGTLESGLRFFHADGAPYGSSPSAAGSDALEKAFLGLRGLGFSERDSRQALDRVRSASNPGSVEQLLRASLQLLA